MAFSSSSSSSSPRLIIIHLHLLLCLTVAGQETVVLRNNYNIHQSSSSIAATVAGADLFNLSSSVIMAEKWLRNHVLRHYPSSNITSVVVGEDLVDLFCNTTAAALHQRYWPNVLPSAKNLHYSLVRWGLVRDIKASIAFSHDCFFKHHHRQEQEHRYLIPVLSFLQDSNSIYSINPPPHLDHSPMSTARLISTHRRVLNDLGFYRLKISVLGERDDVHRTTARKLIFSSSSSFTSSPYPEKPKPSGFQKYQPSPSPTPTATFSFVPSASPSEIPPDVFPYDPPSPPPCLAFHREVTTPSPAQQQSPRDGLWCVAKPAVPAETLQKGIDFACGKGGADCEEIGPKGNCYYPDNVVAHASYAYNSYWQKTRANGGSCGFDGTAILIDADPSFLHCRFEIGD